MPNATTPEPDRYGRLRVLDKDTGHERTVQATELPHGNYEVLAEPASHPLTGLALPPVHNAAEPELKSEPEPSDEADPPAGEVGPADEVDPEDPKTTADKKSTGRKLSSPSTSGQQAETKKEQANG